MVQKNDPKKPYTKTFISKDPRRYDDMLQLPHHKSQVHPPMSMENRAAQFSPFQALTGYQDIVKETARLTQEKIQLDETSKAQLDQKLNDILNHPNTSPLISITWFIPDAKKSGGDYITCTGNIKKIDPIARKIILAPTAPSDYSPSGRIAIYIDSIVKIDIIPQN